MATLVGTQRDVLGLLDALIELDCDAIEAHRVAIDRLECDAFRHSLEAFMEDHQRHVQDLSQMVRNMGHQPPPASDCKNILTQGKAVLSHVLGGDRAILTAMLANKEDTAVAYERAVVRHDVPPDVKLLAERHLADERSHHSWIVLRLHDLEGIEIDMEEAAEFDVRH